MAGVKSRFAPLSIILSAVAVVACSHHVEPSQEIDTSWIETPYYLAAQKRSARIFEFKGSNTEEESPLLAEPINRSNCHPDRPDVFICTEHDAMLSGYALKGLGQSFYKRKLYSVDGEFVSSAYEDVLAALTAIYGPPDFKSGWWGNGGPHAKPITDRIMIWAFKGGQLRLESLGSRSGLSCFKFESDENAPPAEPRVEI